ncbi:MAG: adenylate/guanylate cyclase domain-containing protein [Paracoccaceae bacterium]
MSGSEKSRKIAVIFVADVVGYSKHMEKDEDATLKAYSECEKILKKLLKKYVGSIFNTGGDSALVEFPSAVNAVECAVDFQNEIKERNASDKTETKLEFRIGINMGDVVQKEGNLLGDGVNIAARLEALAQPNGITISKSVYDLVVPKTKVTFNDLGVQKVKQNTFHAYDILLGPSQKRKLKTQSTSNTTIFAGIAAALIIAIAGFFMFGIDGGEEQVENKVLVSDRPAILIMPFKNRSAESGDFISQGITDTLISTLSNYQQLLVQSSNTSDYIDKNELSDEEIKAGYGINYIVSGAIQVSGEKLRINVQLNDLVKQEIIWSDKYDFQMNDLFEIQDEISEKILDSLSLKLTTGTTGLDSRKYFKTVDNWRKSMVARADFIKGTPESIIKMNKAVDELLLMEPNNPTILLMKGWAIFAMALNGLVEDNEKKARESYDLALRAIDLGPDLADAYMLASFLELNNKFNVVSADQNEANNLAVERARKAAELDKSSPHNFGAVANTLAGVGKVEEAITYYRKALVIAPHAETWIKMGYINALSSIGRFDEAKPIADEVSQNDQFVANVRGRALAMLAYIAFKENNSNLAKAYIEQFKSLDFKLTLEDLMFGLWNLKSNQEFIQDYRKVVSDLGVN